MSTRRSRGRPNDKEDEGSPQKPTTPRGRRAVQPDQSSDDSSPSKQGPSKRPTTSKRRSKDVNVPESSSDESSPVKAIPPKKPKNAQISKKPNVTPSKGVKSTEPPVERPQQPPEPMEVVQRQQGKFEEDETHSDEEGGLRIGDIYIPPPPPATSGVNQSGPRLIITHIENENFKSYAGKTVLGPFHKCFTAIVGPNGSGKSNVIDSMLFVFGYRASKIRSKKISVLLHNSDEHKNVQSCTVAVHFVQIIDKVCFQLCLAATKNLGKMVFNFNLIPFF